MENEQNNVNEKSRNTEKYKRVLVFAFLTIILLGAGAITYSFFNTSATRTNEQAKLQTGTMSLTFSDGKNEINEQLMFGESVTKEFTIENTGTLEASAKINWTNMINTYMKGSLTYDFEYKTTLAGEYTKLITDNYVPVSDTVLTTDLISNLKIPVGETYYYKLTITLNNLEDIDQTADLKAIFSTTFSLEDSRNNIEVMFDLNGGKGANRKSVVVGSTYGSLPIPEKEGSTFLGWYTELENGTDVTETTKVETTENHTLYAHWDDRFNAVSAVKAIKSGKTPTNVNEGNPDFPSQATTDEGVYALPDDYGTSYYYRGDIKNNYVKFAGFYWRIIRVNGDGSLRLLYDGTSAHENSDTSTDRVAWTGQAFNANYNDAKYVGYMYGPEGTTASTNKEEAQTNTASSDIKTKLEEWYVNNLVSYDEYIADSIFCYDRSTPDSNYALGYGVKNTHYGSRERFNTNGSTSQVNFICQNKNDKFTKEDIEKGNGALSQKIGLITADEAVAGGTGKYNSDSNTKNYLYKKNWYWSGSPASHNGSYAHVFYVHAGYLTYNRVIVTGGVAPVINLTPEYVMTLVGDGTMNSPFREANVEP